MIDKQIKKYESLNKKAPCTTYILPKEKIKENNIIEEKKELNQELKIDPELRDLLPPLTEEEFNILEENIKSNGCIDPIVTWNDYIVDGHNRYSICTKNNIEFKVTEISFKSKEDVIQWMVETQLGRRNLSPLQRIQIAEKYRPTYQKQSEERMLAGKSDPMQKSSQGSTRDALAKVAKVSHDTYNKGKKIIELEEQAKKGEVELDESKKLVIEKVKKDEIKVNTAFNELFSKEKVENKPKQDIKEEKPNIIKQETISNVYETNNKITVSDNNEINLDNQIKEIVKELKTYKSFDPTFNFSEEFKCIHENMKDYIDDAFEILFERHDYNGEVEQVEKEEAIKSIDVVIFSLETLKNKINNIKLKENK